MFELQSATFTPLAEQVMLFISTVVVRLPNSMSITGHTDATQFTNAGWIGQVETVAGPRPDGAAVLDGHRDRRFPVQDVAGQGRHRARLRCRPAAAQNRRVVIVLNRQAPRKRNPTTPCPCRSRNRPATRLRRPAPDLSDRAGLPRRRCMAMYKDPAERAPRLQDPALYDGIVHQADHRLPDRRRHPVALGPGWSWSSASCPSALCCRRSGRSCQSSPWPITH